MERFDKIMDVLKNMDDCELVSVWNEYCDKVNCFDDYIYSMDELDEIMDGQDAQYILNRAFFGHDQWSNESSFNPNRDWFTFNGYGNLISIDAIGYNEYSGKFMCDCLDEDALANYIVNNEDSLYNDDIQDALDEDEDEDTLTA